MRLAEWPRNPFLNEELREWIGLHVRSLGVEDVAVFATAAGREDDERRVLVATEVGLLDGWYAPRGSSARYSLSVRLYPWQAVHGVDMRAETFRLWAHEHQSRWRLTLLRPVLDTVTEDPALGRALAEFAAACAVMAEPSGQSQPDAEDPVPPFLSRAGLAPAERPRAAIHVEANQAAQEAASEGELAAESDAQEPSTETASDAPADQAPVAASAAPPTPAASVPTAAHAPIPSPPPFRPPPGEEVLADLDVEPIIDFERRLGLRPPGG